MTKRKHILESLKATWNNVLLQNFYDISNVYDETFFPDFKSEIFQISNSINKSSKILRSLIYPNGSQNSVLSLEFWSDQSLPSPSAMDRWFWFYGFILHIFFLVCKGYAHCRIHCKYGFLPNPKGCLLCKCRTKPKKLRQICSTSYLSPKGICAKGLRCIGGRCRKFLSCVFLLSVLRCKRACIRQACMS